MLPKEPFTLEVKKLFTSYSKKIDQDFAGLLWDEFKNSELWVFKQTVKGMIGRESAYFPTIGEVKAEYKRIYAAFNIKKPKGLEDFPPMTDEEAQAEYEKLSTFYAAYPFPEIPPYATREQVAQIDRSYDELMDLHGMEPHKLIHPKVGALLASDLPGVVQELPYDREEREQ